MPTVTDIVDRLAGHRLLGSVPRKELEWLAGRGELLSVSAGEVLAEPGAPIEHLYVLLGGRMSVYLDRPTGRQRVSELGPGDVTGNLPYSRLVTTPAFVVIDEDLEAWAVPKAHFQEMIGACPEITTRLVHLMTDRARGYTSTDRQLEKALSLGKLAAGLAHELNNPASAIARGAKSLPDALEEVEKTSRRLGDLRLDEPAAVALERLRDRCIRRNEHPLGPLERADREDAFAAWLDARGAQVGAPDALVDSALEPEDLEAAAEAFPPEALGDVVEWLCANASAHALASDIDTAATRVFTLVSAVKGFSNMDRTVTVKPLDVGEGLRDTVDLLSGKARDRGITIDVRADELPAVKGVAADLNQVWHHLIDNALDAAPSGSGVLVEATGERGRVVVRVRDAGPGIPAEIRERIFDPFFTTKAVGAGAGLGLDVVRRLAAQHDAEVAFDSEPGRTVFSVALPALEG